MLPSQAAIHVETDERIQALAKKANVEEVEVQKQVDEKVDELKEHQAAEMPDDELRRHAITIVKNDLLNMTGGSGFGGGEAEEIPVLSLGFKHRESDYFVTDGDGIHASGIVNPPDSPAGYGVFVIDGAHGVDLEFAGEVFEPLNTIRANLSKTQVGSRDGTPTIKKGGYPTYILNSTEETKFEIVDPDDVPDDDPISELPGDREAKREMINNNFIPDSEVVDMQTIAEHVSPTNDNGYPVAFGADVKRFRGEVMDSFIFDSGDGTMTMSDDTVFGEEDIPEELIGDDQRTPGLDVSIGGEMVYGENSILDLYGHIEQRDDGHFRFNALGAIPIVEFEYDGPEGSGSSGNENDDAEEESMV